MSVLTAQVLQEKMQALSQWKLEDKAIARHYTFPDFAAAMVFVNAVAREAERIGHHPDIDIRYNKVTLALTTHDQGGVTEKDLEMAHKLDSIS